MEFKPKIKEKKWNKKLEDGVRKKWVDDDIYNFNVNSKKPIFVIDTPPPYPSGRPWHIGAAAHYSQIDMIARTARMVGNEVFFPIGIDRNGLPVELYTERKYNIKIQDVTREKFVSLCITALDDLEAEMIAIMKNMGLSGDFKNYYRTDSTEYRKLTQNTFIELWNKNLVYEDTRPNNYCVDCKTTIADAEIVYEELPTDLIYLKFKLDSDYITVATTRPELLCSCQVLMVNPEDDRHKKLVGKKAEIPLYKRKVKIIEHPYAKPEFGSGIVMMCSYGDYADVRIFRELNLEEIIAIDADGKMTDISGYEGLTIKDARKRIIQDLENQGLIEKREKINHRTPICDRSKTPIEIIPMNEYYIKQLDFKEKLKEISEKMIFHPDEHRRILLNWIDSIVIDWPVSRRRYYGTEIPIWYCKKCRKKYLPKQGYVQPWKEKPNINCCNDEFIGEERTFDTWMDSSISPLFVSKYQKDDKFFRKTFPNTIRPQGKDIIRTWLYYTLLRCYHLMAKPPFKHAWITGYGVDEKGEKMSKSKGNVIDPIPILEKYGADSFRFWNSAEASIGSDFRCSEERIVSSGKFLTKLWNVSRFISSFPIPTGASLRPLDEWILFELNNLTDSCLKGYEDFNFFIPANKVRDFVWNIFAPHYIELVKARAYNGDESAWFTLHECLKTILKLLAPITPFMADFIWNELYEKKSIHKEEFPKKQKIKKIDFQTNELLEINNKIWKAKKDENLSLKAEIKELAIPEKFKNIEKDIVNCHNVKKIIYGKGIKIKL